MEEFYIQLSRFFNIPAYMSKMAFRAFLSYPDYINTPFEVSIKTLARILFIRQPMSFNKCLKLSKERLDRI